MKPCQVIFTYDHEFSKWTVQVKNADSPQDARNAFAAVIFTAQSVNGKLQVQHAKLDQINSDTYEVTPAV